MIIFVYGFPHAGTTILRKLIGEHSLIMDYATETASPPSHIKRTTHRFDAVVFKMPCLPDEKHNECKRIMIMKNPYDIYGSFYLRFRDKYLTFPGRTLDEYEIFLNHFNTTEDFTVKYEELGERLPEIFDYIGFKYEGIKNLSGEVGRGFVDIPDEKPGSQFDGDDHAYYRLWQINQPFKDMTGESAKHLPEAGRKEIDKRNINYG